MKTRLKGIYVEIIEVLGDQILVQEVLNGCIYLVNYWDFEPDADMGYNSMSNIISMYGWTQSCQKSEPQPQKIKRRKRKDQKSLLRLIK